MTKPRIRNLLVPVALAVIPERADPALAARLSRAGAERVRGFTWEATAAAYDDLYSLTRAGR